jgi:hypothetical protein
MRVRRGEERRGEERRGEERERKNGGKSEKYRFNQIIYTY